MGGAFASAPRDWQHKDASALRDWQHKDASAPRDWRNKATRGPDSPVRGGVRWRTDLAHTRRNPWQTARKPA